MCASTTFFRCLVERKFFSQCEARVSSVRAHFAWPWRVEFFALFFSPFSRLSPDRQPFVRLLARARARCFVGGDVSSPLGCWRSARLARAPKRRRRMDATGTTRAPTSAANRLPASCSGARSYRCLFASRARSLARSLARCEIGARARNRQSEASVFTNARLARFFLSSYRPAGRPHARSLALSLLAAPPLMHDDARARSLD